MTEKPHERLDRLMNKRRLELGLLWADVAKQGPVTTETMRAVRRGENEPTDTTKSRIERALQWRHGSIDAILSGGEPSPVDSAPQRTAHDELDRIEEILRSPDARANLRRIIGVLQALLDASTDPEERAVLRGLIAQLGGPLPRDPKADAPQSDKEAG